MAATSGWTIKGGRVLDPAPFLVAGILNVTPDSFYDGGRHADPEQALEAGRNMARAGADVVDVGGESTRPFAAPVPLAEEMDRVLPIIQTLAGEFGSEGPVLSVDTTKAPVARAALEAGAGIVNDVSACRFDPGLLDVVVQARPGYVLMHSQGSPEDMQADPRYGDVISEIMDFFEERMDMLVKAGLPEENIVLDPGMGFGKTLEHNLAILRRVEKFLELGRPLLVGLSNKSIWGSLLDLGPDERHNATQAATTIMAMRGVAIHRVHDVVSTKQTLAVVRALTDIP